MKTDYRNDLGFGIWLTSNILAHELYMCYKDYLEIDQHNMKVIYYSIYSSYSEKVKDAKTAVFINAHKILKQKYGIEDIFKPRKTNSKPIKDRKDCIDIEFAIWITAEMLAHELFMDWDYRIPIEKHDIEITYYNIYSRYIVLTDQIKDIIYNKAYQILNDRYKISDIFIPKPDDPPKPKKTKEELEKEQESELKSAIIHRNGCIDRTRQPFQISTSHRKLFDSRMKEALEEIKQLQE